MSKLTPMDDPFAPRKPFTLGNYRVERIVLSPDHWNTYRSKRPLTWGWTKFNKSNAARVPSDRGGVYTFLVQPQIAEHPACSYLMYVGKTEDQSLRKRFRQYFNEQEDSSDRVHITKMLQLWRKHLWFYFAPVNDIRKIDGIEQALMNAFLPPYNHRYRGVVARQLRYLFS
jgi:hypothetical protein